MTKLPARITLLCCVAALAACAPVGGEPPPPAEPTSLVVVETGAPTSAAAATPALPAVTGTVRLWYAYGTDTPEEQTLRALIAGAQAQFPAAQFELLGFPPEQLDSQLRSFASGDAGGPDLVMGPLDALIGHWRAGVLKPLDDARPYLTSPRDAAIAAASVNGTLYSLPMSLSPAVLYYNRELLGAPPATVDDLLAQVRGGQRLLSPDPVEDTLGWGLGFGARIADASGTCVADAGAASWVGLLRALRAEAPVVTFGPPAETSLAAFRAGEAAMVIDGAERLAEFQEALGDVLGIAAVPAAGGQTGSVVRVDGIYVSAASTNALGAQALALHLTSLEAQRAWSAGTGRLPADASLAVAAPPLRDVETIAEAAPYRPQLRAPWGVYPQLEALIAEGDPAALAGQLDAVCAALGE